MVRITQNRRIALFLLWSFNQSEAEKTKAQKKQKTKKQKKKQRCRNICLMKRKIFFMIAKNIIKSINIS